MLKDIPHGTNKKDDRRIFEIKQEKQEWDDNTTYSPQEGFGAKLVIF